MKKRQANFTVHKTKLGKNKKQKAAKQKHSIPNASRAVCNGHFATIINGRRFIKFYRSGEPLRGRIEA